MWFQIKWNDKILENNKKRINHQRNVRFEFIAFFLEQNCVFMFWKKNSSSADLPLNKDNEIKWFFGAKRKVCCESESRFGRRGAEMSKADSIKCECDCDRTLFWPKRARTTHAFANCLNLSLDSKLTNLSFFSSVRKHLLQSHFQFQQIIVQSFRKSVAKFSLFCSIF